MLYFNHKEEGKQMDNKEWLVTSLVNDVVDYKYCVAENMEEAMGIVQGYYDKTNRQVKVLSAHELKGV